MGNAASTSDPRHVRIWQNLASLQSNEARMRMLDTLMAGSEYVNAAKRAGVYSHLLQWIASYRRGESPHWPGVQSQHYSQQFASTASTASTTSTAPTTRSMPLTRDIPPPPSPHLLPNIQIPQMNEPRKVVKENTLATVPPPKRALDTLHESYRILSIDDSKPLTHETLKASYKRAAARAHPDRGGSSEAFDEVTRAFLYLEEVMNKLMPRYGKDTKEDPRFTAPVTKEAAIKARDGPLTKYDAEEAARGIARSSTAPDPKIALNPKNLNLNVFNQLFEENRLPDPDQDGYGDWLKSNGDDLRLQNESQLRSKFNAEIFNKTFAEQGVARGDVGNSGLTKYQAPDAIAHHGGTELGAGRPRHFISPMGAKTGYTDLKYAYGEGSTFSQEVAGVSAEQRNFDSMKREREAAPVPLSAEEQHMLESIERQKNLAEEERRRRLAVHDVAAEDTYTKLQRRLMIQ